MPLLSYKGRAHTSSVPFRDLVLVSGGAHSVCCCRPKVTFLASHPLLSSMLPRGAGASSPCGGLSFFTASETVYCPALITYSLGSLFRSLWTCGNLLYALGQDLRWYLLSCSNGSSLGDWKSFSWHLCHSDTIIHVCVCVWVRVWRGVGEYVCTPTHTCAYLNHFPAFDTKR